MAYRTHLKNLNIYITHMQKAIQWNHALAVEKSIYNNKRTPQALIVSNSDPTSTGKQKRANDIEMELEKQNAISDKWVDDSILELPQAKQKKKKRRRVEPSKLSLSPICGSC